MKRKLICLIIVLLLSAALAAPALAAENTGFVYDEADLLTPAEEAALIRKLASASAEYEAQIVVVTLASTGGIQAEYLEDYVYDSMGFGYGDRRDGVMLLMCMDIREYRILSNGYAGIAIDPDDIDRIGDRIVDDLSAGNYARAFDTFADACAYYLDGYINGYPFDAGQSLAVSLAIGIVVGLVVVLVLRSQLTSVRKQQEASAYMRSGSMKLTASNDIFLYRNVTRTKRETNNGSSGGGGGGARSRGGGSF